MTGGLCAVRGRRPGTNRLLIEMSVAAFVFRRGHRLVLSIENHAYHRPLGQSVVITAPYFENYSFSVTHTRVRASKLELPLEPVVLSSRATVPLLSRKTGGTIPFTVDGGPARAGQLFFLLVTGSGTVPGMSIPGGTLPINFDAISQLAFQLSGTPFFSGFTGKLDAQGLAHPSSTFPAGLLPSSTVGVRLSFAAAAFDGSLAPSSSAAREVRIGH